MKRKPKSLLAKVVKNVAAEFGPNESVSITGDANTSRLVLVNTSPALWEDASGAIRRIAAYTLRRWDWDVVEGPGHQLVVTMRH